MRQKSDAYRSVSSKINNHKERKIKIQENLGRIDDQNQKYYEIVARTYILRSELPAFKSQLHVLCNPEKIASLV